MTVADDNERIARSDARVERSDKRVKRSDEVVIARQDEQVARAEEAGNQRELSNIKVRAWRRTAFMFATAFAVTLVVMVVVLVQQRNTLNHVDQTLQIVKDATGTAAQQRSADAINKIVLTLSCDQRASLNEVLSSLANDGVLPQGTTVDTSRCTTLGG